MFKRFSVITQTKITTLTRHFSSSSYECCISYRNLVSSACTSINSVLTLSSVYVGGNRLNFTNTLHKRFWLENLARFTKTNVNIKSGAFIHFVNFDFYKNYLPLWDLVGLPIYDAILISNFSTFSCDPESLRF